ncbi:MFS transporter [Gluconacetobacter tumulicola]|uniref:NarK/NasA family nitrate transporter n=1 Tax=Gluconacetobacter tumulicola TaxID=1017177 RepID=A0A7W4P9G6_9PROT|nr:NarK/NasA family nitrate transporter [Gluconacetobacter tumulicola]
MDKGFFKAGNPRTLLAAFLYFDVSFMVWVLLGPLGIAISRDLHLNAGQKGFLVAIPVLAGALFRVAAGALVDHFGPRRVAISLQLLVIAGLGATWLIAPHTYLGLFPVALILGVAGASFAVALPLASGWYPPHYQGTALGIAGAGNSGTALAALFAPGLAVLYGWVNVLGLATLPLAAVLAAFLFLAKEPPRRPSAGFVAWLPVLKKPDCWALMFFYGVTFGGFVGLASFLTIYFNDQYGLSPAVAGSCTALVVFAGSFIRPLGGALADRVGGDRALCVLYGLAAAIFALIGCGLPTIWLAFPAFFAGMLVLGLGNGAVFQIVPTRFPHQVGILTGLVGMSGGVGGFYLASSLGAARQATGSYGPGFLAFGGIALLALLCVSVCHRRWKAAAPSQAAGMEEIPASI